MIFLCVWLPREWGKEPIKSLSLTWVCFSLWVLICFKFLGLVFSCGFDDFLGWRFWGLMIFLGWRFNDFSGLEVLGFDNFSGLEVC